MTTRRHRDRERATDHAKQASALQRAAETLLQMNHPHAAHLLACHAGITAGDAITIHRTGEAHRGEHSRAGETLLDADRTLSEEARLLGILAEEKNTIAYKVAPRNVPRHEKAVSDSRRVVEAACEELELEAPKEVLSGEIDTLDALQESLHEVMLHRNLNPQADPWETLLILLEALHSVLGDKRLREFADEIRRRAT